MKIHCLLLLLAMAQGAHAQPDTVVKKTADSLSYRKPFFSIYPKIMAGGEDLTKGQAAALFQQTSSAAVYYQKYRNQYKTGLYSFGGFFVFTAISALSLNNGNRALSGTGLLLSIASFTSSIILMSMGEANLRKAIKAYHQHTLRY